MAALPPIPHLEHNREIRDHLVMERILVTGASGFVGKRLLPALADAFPHAELIAAGRQAAHPVDGHTVRTISGSLLDDTHLSDLASVRPDLVIHLAARSSVAGSLKAGFETMQVNLGGTIRLAEALVRGGNLKAFIFASSAEVYGRSFNEGPATEDRPLRPANAYARSKAAGEWALSDMLRNTCRVCNLRLFNHSGPGQDQRFVIPSFAAQVARAELGQGERTVKVGSLSAQRDFLHIDDVISAYLASARYALAAQPGVETINIASGHAVAIQSILDGLIRLARVELRVETDPERLRPSEVPVAVGDCRRAEEILGWRAGKPLERTLEDVLNYWREELSR